MIHFRRGERIAMWSRNCIGLNKKYGFVRAFGDTIKAQFRCKECVDGEMMAWDEQQRAFIPFGSNRTMVQEQKQKRHLCFTAFVLTLDGELVFAP